MGGEGIEWIVNRQVRRWEQERKERQPATPARPCITVSREFGSLGAKVAEAVARHLSYTFYDQELVTQIAQSEKVASTLLNSVDERVRDQISEWVAEQFGKGQVTASQFIQSLTRVIRTIGYHGAAVIVGRGAQFILDPSCTLRVRAFAPLEDRVRHIASSRGVSMQEATALVAEMDRQRAEFYQKFFGRDWAAAEGYDLFVNTSAFPPEAATRLVLKAFEEKFPAHACGERRSA